MQPRRPLVDFLMIFSHPLSKLADTNMSVRPGANVITLFINIYYFYFKNWGRIPNTLFIMYESAY